MPAPFAPSSPQVWPRVDRETDVVEHGERPYPPERFWTRSTAFMPVLRDRLRAHAGSAITACGVSRAIKTPGFHDHDLVGDSRDETDVVLDDKNCCSLAASGSEEGRPVA